MRDIINEKNPNWKGGISKIIKKCKDCNITISYNATYCKSCSAKHFNNNSKHYLNDKIIRLYQKGIYISDICIKLNISRSKIFSVFKSNGIKSDGRKKPYNQKYKENHSRLKKEFYKLYPEKHPNRIMASRNFKTYIELLFEKFLIEQGIKFEFQKKIGTYFIDFYLLPNILIECDGAYWHKDKKYEKKRDDYLISKGYVIYHFTGKSIKNSVVECYNKINGIIKCQEELI